MGETTQLGPFAAGLTELAEPRPGLYAGVPAATYHKWDLCCQSRLNWMRGASPAHCRWRIDHPEQTPALALGTALHTLILDGLDAFRQVYAVAPSGIDRRTKDGKERWAAFTAEAEGKTILDREDADALRAMRESVLAHPAALQILGRARFDEDADRELSAVWLGPVEGLFCKARFDMMLPSIGAIFDLKTTQDASPDAFARSIVNYGYHVQAAHYMRGAAAVAVRPIDRFGFIAIEKTPPYAVAVYQLDAETIQLGEEQLVPLYELYARCRRDKRWPGYPDEIQTINAPAWALRPSQLC